MRCLVVAEDGDVELALVEPIVSFIDFVFEEGLDVLDEFFVVLLEGREESDVILALADSVEVLDELVVLALLLEESVLVELGLDEGVVEGHG